MPVPRKRFFFILFLVALCSVPADATAQSGRSAYRQYVEQAATEGWTAYPEVVERWRQDVNPSELWGYDSPAQPIYLADILGFLYEETGDERHARQAAELLAGYGDLRTAYPDDYAQQRAEYVNGVPALANFFFLPPYSRAYLRIRDSDALDEAMRTKVEEALAHSLDFVFHFPEWGAHNRAMLRAEGLYYGALAMPDHPNAGRWRQMAETLASDNLTQWEVEDASAYHPVWLKSLLSYAEISGRDEVLDGPILRYYAEYFKRLFTPAYNIPDFGDADWNPSWADYLPVFEKLASRYQDGELKWVADRMFEKMTAVSPGRGVGAASALALAYRWSDETLAGRQPTSGSQEVLEDVVGKKIVFRDGWEPDSTYLLLNYRDEGDGGFVHREFLRNTITVEEEKMHHGHSDENDISLLMAGGSVLLHDGGYRDGLPSGEYGAFRADYYHNRMVVRKDRRDAGQPVFEFIRSSGAYRPVRTQKIDFLTFEDVEMSRTRLIDDDLGYRWDRIITHLTSSGAFVVIDAVEATTTDYFTYSSLWHTQTIHERGPRWYDTSIDAIRSVELPRNERLLIQFLTEEAKTDGTYDEWRHYQDEQAIYQTQSSHYRAGDMEVFVTALVPHGAGEPIASLLDRMRLLPLPASARAVGVEITDGASTSYLGVKLDLESEVVRQNIRPRYTWDAGRVTYGPLETDAHFVFATVSGSTLRYAASEVLKVLYDDRVVMEALPNTHGLQPDGAPDRVGYVKWRFWEDTVELD